jgi:hypothetical protein
VFLSQSVCVVLLLFVWPLVLFLLDSPRWHLVSVAALILVPGGWPGMLLARRLIKATGEFSWITIATATFSVFCVGFGVIERGHRGTGGGWFPVLGLDEAAATWVFVGALPYVAGVAASFVTTSMWATLRRFLSRLPVIDPEDLR